MTREVGRDVRYVQGAGTIGDYLDVQSALRYGPPPDSEPADSEPAAPTRRAEQHPPPPDPGPQAPRRGPSLLGVTSGPTTPEARESNASTDSVHEPPRPSQRGVIECLAL